MSSTIQIAAREGALPLVSGGEASPSHASHSPSVPAAGGGLLRICARPGCGVVLTKRTQIDYCCKPCYALSKTTRRCATCGGPTRRGTDYCSDACKVQPRHGQDVKDRIIYLRKAGMSKTQIARETGMSVGSVGGILDRSGVRSHRLTLSDEQREIIRKRYPTYEGWETIARDLNSAGKLQCYSAKQLHKWAVSVGIKRPGGMRVAKASERVRSFGGGLRSIAPPPIPGVRPITIPLRELIRIAGELRVKRDLVTDVNAVSAAARKADKAHPGFRLSNLARGMVE